jgi:nitroreductase
MSDKILAALNWRYATQIFDPEHHISDADLKTILESGRLAPSSFGLEAWKFIVVNNREVRSKLLAAAYNQSKVSEASHLVIIARRTDVRQNLLNELIERVAKIRQQELSTLDGFKQMIDGYIANFSDDGLDNWTKNQSYIPLGIMMETASLLNIDNAAIEGFVPSQVDDILGLKAKNLTATTMLALGYRGEDSAAKRLKVRREFSEVVEFID